jgi:isoquinoline 1-oxidoreductase subunit alpha
LAFAAECATPRTFTAGLRYDSAPSAPLFSLSSPEPRLAGAPFAAAWGIGSASIAGLAQFLYYQRKSNAEEDGMVAFTVNGLRREVDINANTPLLWVLRDHLKLTGTKFGCGIAACGACTVHVDGQATRACVTSVATVEGKSVTTIEGLSPDGSHPLQKAWVAEQVPQCGYCQSGQIMQAAELLARNKKPSREEIVEHMDGNICRCGTYLRIVSAIERAAREG